MQCSGTDKGASEVKRSQNLIILSTSMSREDPNEQLLTEDGPTDIFCLQLGTITATAGSYYHQTQFLVQMFILKSEV